MSDAPKLLPAVVGHRGAAAAAPENTLASIREAARQGARGVEIDVALTADRLPVLMHDPTLERTTSGRGALDATPAAALGALDAGAWFGPGFAGEAVPDLAAAVALVLDLDLALNVEIKPAPGRDAETAREAFAVLRALWPEGRPRPVLSSFSRRSLEALVGLAADWPRALLVKRLPDDWRAAMAALGCRGLHAGAWQLRGEEAAEIKAAGHFLASYTVNRASTAERLFGWGVDTIITDRPAEILAIAPS